MIFSVKRNEDFEDLSGFSGLFSSSFDESMDFIQNLKNDPEFGKETKNIEFLEITVKNLQFENEKNKNRVNDLETELAHIYKEAELAINLNKKLIKQVEEYKSLIKNKTKQ